MLNYFVRKSESKVFIEGRKVQFVGHNLYLKIKLQCNQVMASYRKNAVYNLLLG